MSKDERIYLERIAVALEEKAEIEHPDKGYLDSKTYMERIADAVEQLPSGGGGITPTGNIAITENTTEGSPLNIAQYATATVNVAGGGGDSQTVQLNIIIDENTTNNGVSVSSIIIDSGDDDMFYEGTYYSPEDATDITLTMLLYDGSADFRIGALSGTIQIVSISSDITQGGTLIDPVYTITGNGTMHVKLTGSNLNV